MSCSWSAVPGVRMEVNYPILEWRMGHVSSVSEVVPRKLPLWSPFGLKIGTLREMGTLTKDQPGVSRAFSIFGRFACDFGITATSGHLCFSQNWQGKNWVLNFSWRFRRFSANKSSKQNAETEQARPQLYFGPKITKIHLVVLENELIEVCMLIPKSAKNYHAYVTPYCVYCSLKGPLPKFQYMKALHVRDRFWCFFETSKKNSNDSFSKTTKWILMIFCAK